MLFLGGSSVCLAIWPHSPETLQTCKWAVISMEQEASSIRTAVVNIAVGFFASLMSFFLQSFISVEPPDLAEILLLYYLPSVITVSIVFQGVLEKSEIFLFLLYFPFDLCLLNNRIFEMCKVPVLIKVYRIKGSFTLQPTNSSVILMHLKIILQNTYMYPEVKEYRYKYRRREVNSETYVLQLQRE